MGFESSRNSSIILIFERVPQCLVAFEVASVKLCVWLDGVLDFVGVPDYGGQDSDVVGCGVLADFFVEASHSLNWTYRGRPGAAGPLFLLERHVEVATATDYCYC